MIQRFRRRRDPVEHGLRRRPWRVRSAGTPSSTRETSLQCAPVHLRVWVHPESAISVLAGQQPGDHRLPPGGGSRFSVGYSHSIVPGGLLT